MTANLLAGQSFQRLNTTKEVYQEWGRLSETELKAIARDSIEALARQMELISQAFGVERSGAIAASAQLKAQLKAEVRQAVQEALQELSNSGTIALSAQTTASNTDHLSAIAQPDPNEMEGVDFDEDALLGDLFENVEIAA
jgi:hypothetical protein